MHVEIPPSQDSPKHILKALNEDCIQLILRKLENVRDFLNAAETCTRFQANAKITFRAQYKEIRIDELKYYNKSIDRYTVTLDRLDSFLSIFGHLIMELHYIVLFFDKDNEILNMIADYCGKTLNKLRVGPTIGGKYHSIYFNTRSKFQALEELEIRRSQVFHCNYHSQLYIY